MKPLFILLAGALLFVCLGCDDGDDGGMDITVYASGQVTYGLDGFTFQAPEGALSADKSFKMDALDNVQSASLNFVSPVYEFGPQTVFLENPVNVGVPYDPSLLLGPEGNLTVYSSLSLDSSWVAVEGCDVVLHSDRVNCQVSSLRYLAVGEHFPE